MDNRIKISDLDVLVGEILPERTVLSTVTVPFNNAAGSADGGGSASSAAAASSSGGDGGGQGTTSMSSCQSINNPGTPGLFGSLGLGSNNPGSSHTCTPAVVSGH